MLQINFIFFQDSFRIQNPQLFWAAIVKALHEENILLNFLFAAGVNTQTRPTSYSSIGHKGTTGRHQFQPPEIPNHANYENTEAP